MIYIFFGSSLVNVYLLQVYLYIQRVLSRESFCCPHARGTPSRSILNRVDGHVLYLKIFGRDKTLLESFLSYFIAAFYTYGT